MKTFLSFLSDILLDKITDIKATALDLYTEQIKANKGMTYIMPIPFNDENFLSIPSHTLDKANLLALSGQKIAAIKEIRQGATINGVLGNVPTLKEAKDFVESYWYKTCHSKYEPDSAV